MSTTIGRRSEARARGLAMFARLWAAARAKGLTARDLARATGIRETTLSEWRRGQDTGRGPSYGQLDLIAEAVTGKDLEAFLRGGRKSRKPRNPG